MNSTYPVELASKEASIKREPRCRHGYRAVSRVRARVRVRIRVSRGKTDHKEY